MNSHLVPVEVRIKRRTNQRVNLNGFPFDQNRLKGLDSQTMQRGSSIQQDRMFIDDLLQDIPDDGMFRFHHFLGTLDGGRILQRFKSIVDKGFKQFKRHFLRQSALMQT